MLVQRKKKDTTTTPELATPDLSSCAGYLGHLFAELDVLRFIERTFLVTTQVSYGLAKGEETD